MYNSDNWGCYKRDNKYWFLEQDVFYERQNPNWFSKYGSEGGREFEEDEDNFDLDCFNVDVET